MGRVKRELTRIRVEEYEERYTGGGMRRRIRERGEQVGSEELR